MICPFCKKSAVWCENKEVYGHNTGKSWMIYLCKPCNAYVGCHQNSKKPMGTMANAEMRLWRGRAHNVIDPLWRSKGMRRNEVYDFLSAQFSKEIHIAQCDIEMCKKIIAAVKLLEVQHESC